MPVIMFSASEVIESFAERARALSRRLLELSDLAATPLAPGESPDTRRHEIAKVGKRLAEAFLALDSAVTAVVSGPEAATDHNQPPPPAGGEGAN